MAAVTSSTPQEDSPYTEVRGLLNATNVNASPPYADEPETPTPQTKTVLKPNDRNVALTDLELSGASPRGTVSAAPIRTTNNVMMNVEMGTGHEFGEWFRLSGVEKNSLLAGLEPFKLTVHCGTN